MATGLGQITALIGTYLALAQIVLMARVSWIDHVVGSDRLMAWHRWLGIGTITLILSHVVLTTTGWAMGSGSGVVAEFLALNETWDILIATVGTVLLTVVAVTSIRAVRRRLSYETWYGLHLYAYIGIALCLPAPADHRRGLHRRHAGRGLLGRALRGHLRPAPLVPGADADPRVRRGIDCAWPRSCRRRAAWSRSTSAAATSTSCRSQRASSSTSASCAVVAGGGRTRSPSRLRPTAQYLRMTIKDLGDDSHRMLTHARRNAGLHRGSVRRVHAQGGQARARGHAGRRRGRDAAASDLRGAACRAAITSPSSTARAIPRKPSSAKSCWPWPRATEPCCASLKATAARREMPVDPLAPEWLYRHAPAHRRCRCARVRLAVIHQPGPRQPQDAASP